jgi:hypothetical protein
MAGEVSRHEAQRARLPATVPVPADATTSSNTCRSRRYSAAMTSATNSARSANTLYGRPRAQPASVATERMVSAAGPSRATIR